MVGEHVGLGDVPRPIGVGGTGRQPRRRQPSAPRRDRRSTVHGRAEAVLAADAKVERCAQGIGGSRGSGEQPVRAGAAVTRPPARDHAHVRAQAGIVGQGADIAQRLPLLSAVDRAQHLRRRARDLRAVQHGIAELRAHSRRGLPLEIIEVGHRCDAVALDDQVGGLRPGALAQSGVQPVVRGAVLDEHHAREQGHTSRQRQPLRNRQCRTRTQLPQRDAADTEPARRAPRRGASWPASAAASSSSVMPG